MTCCTCADVLRFHRGRDRIDFHCLRHGLSWSQVAGSPDWF